MPTLQAATNQNKKNKAFRRWSYKTPGNQNQTEKTKFPGEFVIYDMFNKNYILRNRLKDRNKIIIRP